mmetsp:Transcript_64245/g.134055  ORF Transcript_64245/g.134055 Transcript_64245/m.134055 type:complete len:127 (+) Transcript_64245:150-530(+)|eukprot:CAMPEP_0181332436 /NCGR_PEP_ID=MMETSP1101-20121128/25098_1 /TAXON_ID=46948 /ORGANISM="Rhodomonas abbreviata, Strain Caron Lab Isolate" /LENGTH=126 /DNA_ID=CAMNT_0023442091 /DNA_START=57 /DNA_END=437 /DNA_ORIENTATION=-
MSSLKASIGVWAHRAKWMALAGLTADVAIIGGGCYAMYSYPAARLLAGEVFPPLQDAYYIYANKFSGQEKVLQDREKDVELAAQLFLQARHAQDFTRTEWYGMEPVQEQTQVQPKKSTNIFQRRSF